VGGAHHVEDHIDATPVGELARAGDEVLLAVVDPDVGAELARRSSLLGEPAVMSTRALARWASWIAPVPTPPPSRWMHAEGKPVSAVCHGSAALLNIPGEDGERLIAGRQVTGFANTGERMMGLMEVVPFLLEDELRARGAQYTKARLPFVSHVVSSGRIISGQNPQSARDVGTALVAELRGA
jgi:hypothetical protein